jgi:hypothetical protein
MSPSDIYANALSTLTSARSVMLSPAWQATLDQQTQAVRVSAGAEMLQLQGAILALSNESLSDIATAMSANEAGLTAATAALTQALQDITQVQNVLSKITSALAILAKVLPLL